MFNEETQKDLGVRLLIPPQSDTLSESEDNNGHPMWLLAPLSRQKAHRMASQAALLEFASNDSEEDNDSESKQEDNTDSNSHNRMQHTGMFRVRRNENDKKKPYSSVPLSAALRVSQRAVDQGIITNDSIHDAVVLHLDETGDGGSPLMTLSLNPTRQQVRDRLKLKAAGKRHFFRNQLQPLVEDADITFSDLKVGNGPIKAKVASISTRSGAAFVDCGVERLTKDGNVRVFGMLRFDDIVESALKQDESNTVIFQSTMSDEEAQLIEDAIYDNEDEDWEEEDEDDDEGTTVEDLMFFADDDDDGEEEEMDITHLISTEDGVTSYRDPETGESVVISDASSPDEDFDDEEDDEEEGDLFKNMSPDERLDMISQIMNDREQPVEINLDDEGDDEEGSSGATSISFHSYEPSMFKIGDEVDVYIKSVSKQSGRFMVTLDPSVRGRKAKDMKKESEAEKKLSRLAEKLGGLERIMELEGTECDGIVQAISNTGDWCYVKPAIDDLPVGVAKLSSEDITVTKGDAVRVRIDGIDETRGQLAMTVI